MCSTVKLVCEVALIADILIVLLHFWTSPAFENVLLSAFFIYLFISLFSLI